MRLVSLILLALSASLTAQAHPLNVPADLIQTPAQTHLLTARPAGGMLWFYTTFISSIDGNRSNGYPVTSLYARQALRQHGALWGTLLTIDRLLRDWHEIAHPALTLRTADGKLRYVDPLSRNDIWLREE